MCAWQEAARLQLLATLHPSPPTAHYARPPAHPPPVPADTYTCPTLGTLPRFYKSSEEVIASSGAATAAAAAAAAADRLAAMPASCR